MPKVAIYYRVSTAEQKPDRQVRELRRYARKRKFKVQGEYVDKVSGATRSRPELDRLMETVKTRTVDIVLVWAFDRFAATSHLVTTLEEFQALGVDFVSFSQQIDTTTPAGKLTFTVLAAIAEFEREIIRERVKSGMAAAKAKGKHVGRRRISMTKDRQGVEGERRDGGQLHQRRRLIHSLTARGGGPPGPPDHSRGGSP